jgi:hypothetical protein
MNSSDSSEREKAERANPGSLKCQRCGKVLDSDRAKIRPAEVGGEPRFDLLCEECAQTGGR